MNWTSATSSELQSTGEVLMIRPLRFVGNPQTAASNRFQQSDEQFDIISIQSQAQREFDALVANLRSAGVGVHLFTDTLEPHKPDSIFPNNWVSFHADGTLVLYPMLAPNRRQERRMDILQSLNEQGFRIRQTIDLTTHELAGHYLEGTGSLVLDRIHHIAYACLSPRTDLNVLGDFAQRLDYELITFDASDAQGAAIYHTNVLMCIGTRFAVLCAEAIADNEREAVIEALRATHHEVIDITLEQLRQFCGNVLELHDEHGQACVALSKSAFDAFTPQQRQRLQTLAGALIVTPIPTIERFGGGSVRCMLAELFLPAKTNIQY